MLRRLQALPERRVACLASNFRKCINGVVAHIDGTNAGAGFQARDFDIEQLIHFLPNYHYDATAFRTWVASAESRFVEAIEQAVRHTPTLVKVRTVDAGVAA